MQVIRGALCAALLSSVVQAQQPTMHLTTSDVVKVAQTIARDEGYDIRNRRVYYFDLLQAADGKPLLKGYTSIGFYINANIRSTISIDNNTGQAIDVNSCEIFDYPDLKSFRLQIMSLSKRQSKSPQQLANDAGCSSPKVLNKPASRIEKK